MNADPMKPTDAERAANAIVSLRNDERMRYLSLHFHDQFQQPNRAVIPAAIQHGGDGRQRNTK